MASLLRPTVLIASASADAMQRVLLAVRTLVIVFQDPIFRSIKPANH